ncbi:hypothetical protein F4823DRAFT_316331 [Ustulina deusta]|nr:hypothetical protein F4823DRAFT_316331 [Ustulina deusta]
MNQINNASYSDFVSPVPYYTTHDADAHFWDLKLQHSSFPESPTTGSHESPYLRDSPVPEPRGQTNDETSPQSFQSAQTTQSTQSSQPTQTKPPETPLKPKRRRENRYKNAPPSVISRRRAQNRASQRAYRERKDQRIKDLEENIEELRKVNEDLRHAYEDARRQILMLQTQQQNALWSPDMAWDPAMAFPPQGDGGFFGGEHPNFL